MEANAATNRHSVKRSAAVAPGPSNVGLPTTKHLKDALQLLQTTLGHPAESESRWILKPPRQLGSGFEACRCLCRVTSENVTFCRGICTSTQNQRVPAPLFPHVLPGCIVDKAPRNARHREQTWPHHRWLHRTLPCAPEQRWNEEFIYCKKTRGFAYCMG